MPITLLDILEQLGAHTNFVYQLQGSTPEVAAESITINGDGLAFLATLSREPNLHVEIRQGNLIIRERV